MPWLAAVGALGASIYGALAQADATKGANEANVNLSKDQWNSKILLDQIARGLPYSWDQTLYPGAAKFTEGTPTTLPYYSGTAEIDAYKRANDIFNTVNSANGSPGQQLQSYTNIANQSKPAIANATNAINNLFSGARTQQRIAEQAPVNQARLNTAAGQRSAVYQNLQSRLNELKAKQANSGFVGGSTFDRSAMFRESMPFLQEASNVMSAAKLQNALDEQGIRNQDWNTALANINVPYDLAQKNIAYEQMPANALVSGYTNNFGVYSPFLLGQYSAPGFQNLPTVQPVTSLGGNIANAAGDFLQSYMQNQAQQKAADVYSQSQKDLLQSMINSRNAQASYNNPMPNYNDWGY